MITFNHDVPMYRTMKFEDIFSEELRMSQNEKKELKKKGAEFLYLEVNGELISETYYITLDKVIDDFSEEGQAETGLEIFRKNADKIMYVHSLATLPEFQKRGYGSLIKSYFLGEMYAKGYKTIIGHAKKESIEINKRFGAQVLCEIKNWYDTGESVWLYKIEL